MNGRRNFLKKSALFSLGTLAGGLSANAEEKTKLLDNLASLSVSFSLPALQYTYDALEPFIDKATMEIHHGKHHVSYINNLNKALEGKNSGYNIEDILSNLLKYDITVRNNAGGHFNHSFFWKSLNPGGINNVANGRIADALNATFGSVDTFKAKFQEEAMKRFGSGWVWLIADKNKALKIISTPNQDNPLMDISEEKGTPILALDVWEHAYYLKYQNKRADYIQAWWNVVNWNHANECLSKV
jgi:Fe-Mn family superoxide dismutase